MSRNILIFTFIAFVGFGCGGTTSQDSAESFKGASLLSSDATTVELNPGTLNTGKYGLGYGNNGELSEITFSISGCSAPVTLNVKGYDIDRPEEVQVLANNVGIGYLSRSKGNNRLNQGDTFVVEMADVGVGTVTFRPKESTEKWGVTEIRVSECVLDNDSNSGTGSEPGTEPDPGGGATDVYANAIPLSGVVKSDKYGYNYGSSNSYSEAKFLFNSDGSSKTLFVRGYDVNRKDEVSVWLNSERLGYLSKGPKRKHNNGDQFVLPGTSLSSGQNLIVFRNIRPGETWGITDLQVQSHPQCSATVIDYDGDGWGHESGQSCLVGGVSVGTDAPGTGSRPVDVRFDRATLKRIGGKGDNWCQTWAADDSVVTSMDDGDWLGSEFTYHNRLYRMTGDANNFSRLEIQNYPNFHIDGDGWFGYGVLSVEGILYSFVSKTQGNSWSNGPFRGMKLLRSYDSGNSWNRVDRNNNDKYLDRWDSDRELLNSDEMFFFEESGRYDKEKTAYPFSYASFVQNGKDHSASPDGYVYIYSPEGAKSHELLLARAPAGELGRRSAWQYFSGWDNSTAQWTSDIESRQPNMVYPESNSNGEYFGWYSWLPSVVWNPGLQLYVMVNGGTYAGDGLSKAGADYYDSWMHTKTGSLGLWYSENPYGPWTQFYYTDHWTVDDPMNLTYQPKLSPKWISADGRRMTLIWSDAMRNSNGESHSINYRWNQMEIDLVTGQ